MRPSTLRALQRAAELTRAGRFVEAMATAEPVILAADPEESEEIGCWLTEHADDFVRKPEER
ncbi:hypothetical protein GCM10010211_60840 [Streptomyces albospinus]|uniref:Uncharacterized protein n=1 Tax=Streptomyces albospinus TaxID=285515 RepID=A0ABQ2VH19_9ACTN|nr:hypothetical protein [Streptomyces albospinus]GGU86581.1 hypothetical protein GCM10010211_60840 [Streptomyces albospinus]